MLYQYHEFANLFPMMSEEETSSLRADIAANGLLDEIVLYDGMILDGRNRYEACLAVGVEPRFVTHTEGDPLTFVVSRNVRRNLTPSQKAVIALDIAAMLAVRAEKKQRMGKALSADDDGIRANEMAAKAMGIGKTIVAEIKRVAASNPEEIERIRSGEKTVKQAFRELRIAEREKPPVPRLVLGLTPSLIHADILTHPVPSESIDIIITSPPYNLGGNDGSWPMGGGGRVPWVGGIVYGCHDDDQPEQEYQAWQVRCLQAMYDAAKPGASLFYNHKVRQRDGRIIHPMDWLRSPANPWTLRQEIIWNRTSTHNHTSSLFWQVDERVYWLVKGDTPALPNRPIGLPSVIDLFGPVPDTWHPAPFTPELPSMLLKAVGFDGCVVLDPFAGSCATGVAATELGYQSIMVDIEGSYLSQAANQNGWPYRT